MFDVKSEASSNMRQFVPSERKEQMKDGGDKGGTLRKIERLRQGGGVGDGHLGNRVLSGYQTTEHSSCAEPIL